MGVVKLAGSFLGAGALYVTLKREKEWHAGGNDTLPASLVQVGIVAAALSQISLCYKLQKWKFLSNKTVGMITVSPVALALLETYLPQEKCSRVHRCAQLVTYHVGNVSKVAFIFATLYLAKIGKYRYVASSLSGYGVAVILDSDEAPYKLRKPLKKTLALSYIFYLAFFGDTWVQKGMGAFCLTAKCANYFSPYLYGSYEEKNLTAGRDKRLEDMGGLRTGVEAKHLNRKDRGDVPFSISNLEKLKSAFNDIDWGKHRKTLDELLKHDDQWNNPHYRKEGADSIQFLKEGFEIFLYRMEKKRAAMMGETFKTPPPSLEVRKRLRADISLSNPKSFGALQVILEKICNRESDEATPGILLTLGIQASNYCALRLGEVLQRLDKDLFEEDGDAESTLFRLLREKQLAYLNDVRVKQMSWKPDWYRSFFGKDTPQQRNYYLYCYGEPLGIHLGSVEEDSTLDAHVAQGVRLTFFYWVRKACREFFEEYYTEEHLIEWIQEADHRLTPAKLEKWFRSQPKEHEDPTQFLNDGKLTRESARYFLLQNGVLGLKP